MMAACAVLERKHSLMSGLTFRMPQLVCVSGERSMEARVVWSKQGTS